MDMNGIYPLVSSNMACWDTLPGLPFGDTRGYPHEYPHYIFPLMVDFRSQLSIILPLLMVISQFLIVSILLTPIRILESI